MAIQATSVEQLISHGMPAEEADHAATLFNQWHTQLSPTQRWHHCQKHLLSHNHPFQLHSFLYQQCYDEASYQPFLGPAVFKNSNTVNQSNLKKTMNRLGHDSYQQLQQWSAHNPLAFWQDTIQQLSIQFAQPYQSLCDLSKGVSQANWFTGGRINICDSIWQHSQQTHPAIISQTPNGPLISVSQQQLRNLSARVSHGLTQLHLKPMTCIGLLMPMHVTAVAIYLGVIQAGFSVVAIAESFSIDEIKMRLRLSQCQWLITQDVMQHNSKMLPLYERAKAAAPQIPIIVYPHHSQNTVALQHNDLEWDEFLSDNTHFNPVPCEPHSMTQLLFSSGTTGEPKAIPWTHTTPIKCAADAYYHQNIQTGDVVCWPTSLGWMMGPWLIYAALLNRATIALYEGLPTTAGFCQFVADAKVTMLGLVPSLVHRWRTSKCAQAYDWSAIKVFSSSGECSQGEDMLYLMHLANYKPVIEYCGGTEIGGGYISNTVLHDNIPTCFSTPTLGLDFSILDEFGQAANHGEVAIQSPSLGLSTTLLNYDHEEVYFSGMPVGHNKLPLRRHGDSLTRITADCFRLEGRIDDTMNLSGIKVSSAEIERCLMGIDVIIECAAIAIPPKTGGPSQLVIFAVTAGQQERGVLLNRMQQAIKAHLNPLFNIHDLCLIKSLPRTASNKVMRRILRQHYQENHHE